MQKTSDQNRQSVQEHSQKWHEGADQVGPGSPLIGSTADAQAIDLNHATAPQLMEIEDLEESLALAIVEYRTHHGHFRNWKDLEAVPGLDEEAVKRVQRAARIGGVES